MKKILFTLFVMILSSNLFAEPRWFESPPKSSNYYYFAGVGKSKTRAGAKNAALADVFSQIVYLVRASISSNATFEKYVEENEKDIRKNSSIFKKVRAKGQAVIENFEVDKQETEKETVKGKTKRVFYVLVKVPKSEIVKARKRLEKEAKQKKEKPMGIFAFAVFRGMVAKVDSIKSTLESVYKEMGFNIQSVHLESLTAPIAASPSRFVKYLQGRSNGKIKKAIICMIYPSGVRRERLGRFKVTSLLGTLIIREVNLESGEIISTKKYEGKGISMRRGSDAVEDALRKLIKNLSEEILGKEEEEDDYI